MIQPPEQGIHVDLCRRKKGLRSLRNDGVKMLDHVPPVLTVGLVAGVVSGIVSGGVSLLVVYLSNRSQNERLQMQLIHERELKNREREMALRRDVYLPAVEAMSAGLQALSQFPALGFPTERLTERYQEKAPSVAKAQVIAKEKTVRTFAIFNSELGAIFLRLTLARMPLLLKKPRLQILLEDIGKLKTEHSALLEQMKRQSLNPDRETLQQNLAIVKATLEQAAQEHGAVTASFLQEQFAFMDECIEAIMTLGKLLVPITIAVREEFELPIDETEYRNIIEEAGQDDSQLQQVC